MWRRRITQNYRDGVFAGTNTVIEGITGKPPMTVPAFIAQNRQAFA
jgi:hypothetical protein